MKKLLTFISISFAVVLLTTAEVICPHDAGEVSVYFPHETECGKFYECSSEVPILFQCPTGTYFDVSLNVCNRNVNCGNLSTSTAPPPTTTVEEGA